MPPRARKRTATNGTSEPKKPPAKKPTRAPPKTTARQSKGANTAKGRLSLAEIEKGIRAQGDDFIAFMEEELRSHPGPVLDLKDITNELTPDLEPVLRCMTTTRVRPAWDSAEAPHVKAIAAMNDLQDIIEEYETAIKEEHLIKKPDWMHWKQDAEELVEVNKLAREYAKEATKHIVVPGLHPSSIKPPEAGTELEKAAWELTEDCRRGKTEETWGMAALEQVMTFTKILKLLPGDQTSPR